MVDFTGRQDAEKIKERYQREINNAHYIVKKKVEWLYQMNHKLKSAMADIDRLLKDIVADEEERKELYSSLQNLLKKETDFEKEMWKETQKGQKVKSVTIKQKFNDSDVEELKYGAMMDYLSKYPEYVSKSSFSKVLDKISEIEKGIKRTKKDLHEAISRAKKEIAYFPRNIMEARNNIKAYTRILQEGKGKLRDMRYLKSVLFKMASETSKLGVTLDTLNHQIGDYEDTINRIETEFNTASEDIVKIKLNHEEVEK